MKDLSRTPRRVLCLGREALGLARKHARLNPVGFFNPFRPAQQSEADPMVYSSLEEALEKCAPELVLLSVPNDCKNTLVVEESILKAQLPLAITKLRLDDWMVIHRLQQVARETGTPCFVRDHYHLSPTFQTARIRLQEIGPLQQVCYRFATPPREDGLSPWTRSYRHLVLEDLCYHHFAVIEFLCGINLIRGRCRSYALSNDARIRNAFDLVAETEAAWTLDYSARWGCPRSSSTDAFTSWPGVITFYGRDGLLSVSQEALSINGIPYPTEALLPAVDWVEAVLDRIDDPKSSASCLLTLDDIEPVAKAISRCLIWSED